MAKYLDGAGLDVVWGQIKNTFYSKSGGSIGGEVSLVYGATSANQMIQFSAAGSDPQSVYLGIRRPVASYGPSYKDTAGNWYLLLHEGNYTSFTVKKDGTGASGTWGISISGNATTATTATNLANKPTLNVGTDTNLNKISVTAGGKTSDYVTVPYATSASTATNVSWKGITSVVQAGNEVNMMDYGFTSTSIWFNYKPRDSRTNNPTLLSNYSFGNLGTGYANIIAAGFKKNDSSNSYVLLGGGGDKAVSDFATSDHNHDTVYVKKSGDTLTGPLVFQRSGGTNNYNEGIRFNLSGPSNLAGFTIGGTAEQGTGDGIWAFLVNNKTLYISHNGSSSATYGLTFTNTGALNLKTSSLTNNGNTIITSANIANQSVSYATTAESVPALTNAEIDAICT